MRVLNRIANIIGWSCLVTFSFALFVVALSLLIIVAKSASDNSFARIKTEHAVGVVELTGEIASATKFRKDLRKQIENDKIKAVVVRIDSPGGGVGASEEIYSSIKKATEKKPIVCSLGGIAASGGLYAAVGCQKIVTNRGTLTGSIGVILMLPQVNSLIQRFGLGMRVIKSGQFKDAGSPFRDLSLEDKKLLQSLVDESYEQFVEVVAEARAIPLETVISFADGRIILGSQAVEYKLADEIGGLERAAKLALELAGDNEEPEIIMPEKEKGFFAYLKGYFAFPFQYVFEAPGQARLLYRAVF